MNTEEEVTVEIHIADDIFVKQMALRLGQVVRQHRHDYDHTTMLASGSLAVWTDGTYSGCYCAPTGIFIAAGTEHRFQALSPKTVLYCIHNTAHAPQEEA